MRDFYEEAIIPGDMIPGWVFEPDEDELGRLVRLRMHNSRLGVSVFYGKSPAGNYDQQWIQESGGGGVVSLPYAVDPITKRTYIGLLSQNRPLQDEENPVLNAPRGFVGPDETHDEAAAREYQEETGDITETVRTLLDGAGGNPNNAFFDSREGGMRFYAVRVPWSQLKPNPEGEGYVFDRDNGPTEDQKLERILNCVFIEEDLDRISRLGDMMTLSCYLRFLAARERGDL